MSRHLTAIQHKFASDGVLIGLQDDKARSFKTVDLAFREVQASWSRAKLNSLGQGQTIVPLSHLDISLSINSTNSESSHSKNGKFALCVQAGCANDAAAGRDSAERADRPDQLLPRDSDDAVLRRLMAALRAVESTYEGHGDICADALRLAIVTRQLSRAAAEDMLQSEESDGLKRRPRSLQKWRLKRVVQHVDNNLDRKITLSEMAAVAGLSQMHFAAQFRAAMSCSPHQYVLRRRTERAKELLIGTSTSLVEIALTVGFQTQAHFTTVFKRFVGDTPCRWRSERLASGADDAVPVRQNSGRLAEMRAIAV